MVSHVLFCPPSDAFVEPLLHGEHNKWGAGEGQKCQSLTISVWSNQKHLTAHTQRRRLCERSTTQRVFHILYYCKQKKNLNKELAQLWESELKRILQYYAFNDILWGVLYICLKD